MNVCPRALYALLDADLVATVSARALCYRQYWRL